MIFRGLLLFIFSIFLVFQVDAQDRTVQRDNFIWGTYSLSKSLSSGLNITAAIQSRRYAFPDRHHQLLTTLGLSKKFDSGITLGGGFTYFWQALPISRDEVGVVRPELRPFQSISMGDDLGKWSISHRFIVEERWFRNTDGDELANGYFFQMRFRYRFMIQRPLDSENNWLLVLSEEAMLNGANPDITNVFDQNRVYIGLKKKLSDSMKADVGYLYWYQQFPDVTSFASFHIINIALSHTIN